MKEVETISDVVVPIQNLVLLQKNCDIYKQTKVRYLTPVIHAMWSNSLTNESLPAWEISFAGYSKMFGRTIDTKHITTNSDNNIFKDLVFYNSYTRGTQIAITNGEYNYRPFIYNKKYNNTFTMVYHGNVVANDIPIEKIIPLIEILKSENIFSNKDKRPQVTLGGDPEFGVIQNGEYVHAGHYFEDNGLIDPFIYDDIYTYDHYKSSRTKIGLDGAGNIMEIRPSPKRTPKKFIEEVQKIINGIYDNFTFGEVAFITGGGGKFDLTLGGHIHIGGMASSPYLIQLLDSYIYYPLYNWVDGSHRSDIGGYEGPGKWRVQPHGVEYRSPPSFYSDAMTVMAIYTMVKEITEHIIDITSGDESKISTFVPSSKVVQMYRDAGIYKGSGKTLNTNILKGWLNIDDALTYGITNIVLTISDFDYSDSLKIAYASKKFNKIKVDMNNPYVGKTIGILLYGSVQEEFNIIGTNEELINIVKQILTNLNIKFVSIPANSDKANHSPISIGLPIEYRKQQSRYQYSHLIPTLTTIMDKIIEYIDSKNTGGN
jgi:hypothetical protein